jgi:hypothetical protein
MGDALADLAEEYGETWVPDLDDVRDAAQAQQEATRRYEDWSHHSRHPQ